MICLQSPRQRHNGASHRKKIDTTTLAEKTGKSESLIYSRLALLHLIPDVAEAFQSERITASHANLIARLPQDFQQQAFEACWRKDYQDKEAHLLPAKHLSAWIANNVFLPLDEAPFDREDATLNQPAGACSACPRRSGYNTSLFFDVAADQCLDGNCYHAKLAEHIDREVAARPELVRIETDHRNPKERQPGTLSRWEYTEVEALEGDNEDAEPVTQCGASKPAIVVYGQGAGTTRTVCMDPECPVHHPSRVVPIDPDAEARRKEHEKEQARRRRLEKDRTETSSRIFENAPATFTAPQLRVLLRAFITCDLYGQSDVVATHYAGEDDDNNQSSEEILLSVADRLEEVQLPELALRLALCSHIRIPNENEIDHLAEVEKVFAPKQAKKPTAKKNNVRKPTHAKGKTAKKKATKRFAA